MKSGDCVEWGDSKNKSLFKFDPPSYMYLESLINM